MTSPRCGRALPPLSPGSWPAFPAQGRAEAILGRSRRRGGRMARAAGPAATASVQRTAEGSGRATRAGNDGQVVVISGLSGAGKSQASKLFEDLGYYCVDNLPPDLLEGFIALRDADPARYRNVVLVLDIRAGDPAPAVEAARKVLTRRAVPLQVLYLEASDANLVSRFS